MTRAFPALILAQAAHSIEEYAGRLWEVFAPARAVSGLMSSDPERGFILFNAGLVLFGLWCWLWPVRKAWPSAGAIAWAWVVVELINGAGHTLWAVLAGGYRSGLATAPLLLLAALALTRRLLRD